MAMLTGYHLSGTWMRDHIDCWPSDAGEAPEGLFIGSYWVGPLTPEQEAEIINRAEFYADPNGPDECDRSLIRAAKRVLAVLKGTV